MSRCRIVIAEDSLLIQEALTTHLKAEFDIVATVADGRAALGAVSQHQPDVLLLDGSLPSLNGFEVARLVRQCCRSVKIIFVTAENYTAYQDEAFRAGADRYVLKSHIVSELRQAIHDVAGGCTDQ